MNFLTLTNPMQHQRAAVAKMLPTRIGGLFMEQGTGKTRVVIELAKLRAQKISKVIIFCPVSLKRVWRDEILKHTDCASDSIHVFDDRTSERRLPTAWWYVVGIESMSSSNRVVFAISERELIYRYFCQREGFEPVKHGGRREEAIAGTITYMAKKSQKKRKAA